MHLHWPRADIRVGPSWVGTVIARWALALWVTSQRDQGMTSAAAAEYRARLHSGQVLGQYGVLPAGSFPVVSSREAEAARRQLEEIRRRSHFAAGLAEEARRNLAEANEFLHAHPEIMRAWLDGTPPGPR